MAPGKLFVCMLLLLTVLVAVGECQRGGSRVRARSYSSRSSRSRSTRNGSYIGGGTTGKRKQCITDEDSQNTCQKQDDKIGILDIFVWAVLIMAIYISIVVPLARAISSYIIVNQAMNQYMQDNRSIPSTLNPKDRQNMLNFLRWPSMKIQVRHSYQRYRCQLTLQSIQKRGKDSYDITMRGSDEVGRSTLEGVLVFTGKEMGIKLSKVYDNREKAQQTEEFFNLLFEGKGVPGEFRGKWAFLGFEKNSKYSGTWQMYH